MRPRGRLLERDDVWFDRSGANESLVLRDGRCRGLLNKRAVAAWRLTSTPLLVRSRPQGGVSNHEGIVGLQRADAIQSKIVRL
jgi:hypothetical protein